MSDVEPIAFRPRQSAERSNQGAVATTSQQSSNTQQVYFNRGELNEILAVYGRQVAAGEWRDYAIDFRADKAVFSIFRRSSEFPLYRIEKCPRLARKQGAYSVVTPTGLILKRGSELKRVLSVLEKGMRLVDR